MPDGDVLLVRALLFLLSWLVAEQNSRRVLQASLPLLTCALGSVSLRVFQSGQWKGNMARFVAA